MALRHLSAALLAAAALLPPTGAALRAQTAPGAAGIQPQRPATPPPAPPSRPRPAQVMSLTGPWPDGGPIPPRHSQAGEELSPALTWSAVPEGTASFVLIAHDLDASVGNGTDDVLHWLVWNIPGTATSLPEGVPQGPRPDGSRQISVSGPYYRGPGAPSSGPAHHYAFELFALDSPLNVPATGLSPAETRAAVLAAMAGHVRGKAAYTGTFRRGGR